MARAKKPTTPRAEFLRLLWRAPLTAIPFAAFFTVLFGMSWATFRQAYILALVFSYSISLCVWAVSTWEMRQERRGGPQSGLRGKAIALSVMRYLGASLFGSFAAALLIHFTIIPGFLGSMRSVLMMGMFSLLFASLFIGVSFAFHFYEHAIARARSEEELTLARRIQRSFLRSQFPERPGLEIHALNVSSKQVSGDFYDVVPAGERAFLLCIADVSGKGVPAALLGSMLQASLRTQATVLGSVARILENINRVICDGSPNGQFATVFLARVEEDTLRMTYVNAGHNHPVVFRASGDRIALDRGGIPVGILDSTAFDEGSFQLEPGDRVLFYTDGLSEAMDERKDMFGEERLYDMAAALPQALPAREAIDRLLEGLRGFLAGEEPQDDMTVMMLRVLDGGPAHARFPAARDGAVPSEGASLGGVRS
ncbi:MAG: PP2C family protein-serine/threonine phosphatase [Candidatus Eiseniibacteriota bacterium]